MNFPDQLPLAERVTQGPYTLVSPANPDIFTGKPGAFWRIGKAVIANSAANAELVLEAFNVIHETGRTPRQLADERAELIAALARLHAYTREHCAEYRNALDAESDEIYTATHNQLTREHHRNTDHAPACGARHARSVLPGASQ